MRFYRGFAVLALAVATCFGADVDGKWAGKINTPEGGVPMSFDLKADGGKLTGTAVGPQGQVPISSGIYENGKLTFQLKYHVFDRDVIFNYQGQMAGDEIKLTMAIGLNEPVNFVVKRAAN